MPLTFFSLPPELRNEIYSLIFTAEAPAPIVESSSLAEALLLDTVKKKPVDERQQSILAPLLTCRQFRTEAVLLAFSRYAFHLKTVLPDLFHSRISILETYQIRSIRTVTLTARVAHLRAMNEAWEGTPFGQPLLSLDRLVIIPSKPDTKGCYAEVADLSQCHTLAYVLGETLKSLRNVRVLEIQNRNCFKDFVWLLLYRCVVYKMWKWGGIRCGQRFECSDARLDGCGDEWFKVYLDESAGNEVGYEVCRLLGREGTDPELLEDNDIRFAR